MIFVQKKHKAKPYRLMWWLGNDLQTIIISITKQETNIYTVVSTEQLFTRHDKIVVNFIMSSAVPTLSILISITAHKDNVFWFRKDI